MNETTRYEAVRFDGEKKSSVEDTLTVEEALSVFINSEPLTVTMQTPGNEAELTRGLLFTEGIYKGKGSHFSFEVLEKNELGNITKVNVNIPEKEYSVINKRTLLSVSACGICGKKELDFVKGTNEDDAVFKLNFQHIGILSLEFHVDKLSRPLL